MEKIEAYKCQYCGKVYEQKGSCRSHEYKCHFNVKNKSCASCAFIEMHNHEREPGFSVQFRVCLANKPVAKKLHTRCEKHMPKEYREDKGIMSEMDRIFDKEKAIAEGMEIYKNVETPL